MFLGELCSASPIPTAAWQIHCVHTSLCYEYSQIIVNVVNLILVVDLSDTLNPISLLHCADELLLDVLLKSERTRSTTKAALLLLAEHLLRLSERSYPVLLMIHSPIISLDSSLKVECLSACMSIFSNWLIHGTLARHQSEIN